MEGFELGIRGWMIIIGVLLILAVLLDGYRRVRNDRYGAIKMSRKVGKHNDDIDEDELFKSELPNGGARVVSQGDQDPLSDSAASSEFSSREPSSREPSIQTGYAHDGQSADEILGLKPVTREADEAINSGESVTDRVEPVLTAVEEPIEPESITTVSETRPIVDSSNSNPHPAEEFSTLSTSESLKTQQPIADVESKHTQQSMHANVKSAPDTAAQLPEHVEEVVAIKVLAKKGDKLNGEALLKILTACDCRYGSMGVFHRYEQAKAEGAIQFSIANIMEPGSFDLSTLESSSTPGVVFFVQLPGPKDPVQAYNFMIETAQCVANNLSAEMRDDSHNVMTAQTIEHGKQRVAEFERRRLAKKQK